MIPRIGLRARLPFTVAILFLAWMFQTPTLCAAANLVAPVPPGTCLTAAHPCVTFDVNITRDDAVPLRGFSVTFHLSPELMLCSGASSITQGTYLNSVGMTSFQIIDNGGGSYTVDCAILGQPCGATGDGVLFRVAAKKVAGDGTGVLTPDAVTLRDCANQTVPAAPGASASVTIDYTAPVAVADLAAAQDLAGNGGDGTTAIIVSFTAPGDAAITRVYRAPYGPGDGSSSYPEYNDAPGAAPPTTPTYPPSAPWTITGVTASGQTDEPANRGFWYYAVFTEDACGNVSTVSNVSAGALNYHLGDVSDGLTPCVGDNVVATADISLLGAHYGAVLGYLDPVNCLDVGPTADASSLTLPQTDNRVQFEDLMIFAMNYGQVSFAGGRVLRSGEAALSLHLEPIGSGEWLAHLRLERNDGVVKGVHARLGLAVAHCQVISVEPGELVNGQSFFKTLNEAGDLTVDLARLGPGLAIEGSGEIATVHLRGAAGEVAPRIAESTLRNVDNQPLGIASSAPTMDTPEAVTWQVHPNPMTRATTVSFRLTRESLVSLHIYDASGRTVRAFPTERRAAGFQEVSWSGCNDRGERVMPGVYFLGGSLDGRPFTHKFIVLQ